MPETDYEKTIEACKEQLKQLKVEYLDLNLIHAPLASSRLEQWKVLVELKKLWLVKHIGVSNYNEQRFEEIEDAGLPIPEVNQL
jgi:2,5-diketo-D-gluconate reductase A